VTEIALQCLQMVEPMSTAEAPIKILYVEDDERLASLTVRYFEARAFISIG